MAPAPPTTLPSSPCVKLCILDRETGLCEGCGRTLDEIGRWARMSEDERLTIMEGLDARLRTAFAVAAEGR